MSAKKIIVTPDSSALILPIDELKKVPYLMNETFFDLQVLPQSMIVVGGGPIRNRIIASNKSPGCKNESCGDGGEDTY